MADIDLGFVKGNVIKTGTTAPSSALDGDLFYNTSTYHIYQWDASLSTPTWVDKGSIRGPKGDKGDKGDSGAANVISATDTWASNFIEAGSTRYTTIPLDNTFVLSVDSVTSDNSYVTVESYTVEEGFSSAGKRTTTVTVTCKNTYVSTQKGLLTINYKYLEKAE